MQADWEQIWEPRWRAFLEESGAWGAGHDRLHVQRVVATARRLAAAEAADLRVVLPAAWLHDCVQIAKDSPLRPRASRLAAERAGVFLRAAGYPVELIPAVEHAVAAHSFSAEIPPRTVEAQVVQDADRLDALGAIGLARAVQVGAALGLPLYDADEPFPVTRAAADRVSTVDHFYTKLLRLAETMQTAAGRAEARQRSDFLRLFLQQLAREIGSCGGIGV